MEGMLMAWPFVWLIDGDAVCETTNYALGYLGKKNSWLYLEFFFLKIGRRGFVFWPTCLHEIEFLRVTKIEETKVKAIICYQIIFLFYDKWIKRSWKLNIQPLVFIFLWERCGFIRKDKQTKHQAREIDFY